MASRTLGVAAALAVVASGFIIPSTMSMPDMHAKFELEDLPHISVPDFHLPDFDPPKLHIPSLPELQNSHVTVALECTGCSMLSPQDVGTLLNNVRNRLILQFSVSDDRKSILLNGHQLYPHSENVPNSFRVSQDASGDAFPDMSDQPTRQLSYSASVTTQAPDSNGDKLVGILLHPDALDKESIHVGLVRLDVIESETGDIHILSPEIIGGSDGSTGCDGPEFVCNIVHFVQEKLAYWNSRLKNSKTPCFLNKGSHVGPPPMKGGVPKFMSPPTIDVDDTSDSSSEPFYHTPHHFDDYHNHYDHEDPHGHHGHHEHSGFQDSIHRFAMGLRDFLVGFLIPVLIGIAAGLTASLIGMCVGTSVAWLWIRFVRKGRRGPYARVPQHEDGAVVVGEAVFVGDSVKIEEEAPPVYAEKE